MTTTDTAGLKLLSSRYSVWMRRVWPVATVAASIFIVSSAPEGDLIQRVVDRWQLLALMWVGMAYPIFNFWGIADSVHDGGTHLVVRRGPTSLQIPFHAIVKVSEGAATDKEQRRRLIVLRLDSETELGRFIRFFPQAGPLARNGLFHHLRRRVEGATRAAVAPDQRT